MSHPDAAAIERQGRIDVWLVGDAVADAVEHAHDPSDLLYRDLVQDPDASYLGLLDVPAASFTITGWRFAARLAELVGEATVAAEYRRRALQRAGLDADLDPGSSGYLLTIHPCHVEETATGDLVAYCTVPDCDPGWRKANHDRRRLLEAHAEHTIRTHSTTTTKAGASDAF